MKKISTIVIIFMLFTTLFPASFLAEASTENVKGEETSVEESVILYTDEETEEIHVYEDELLESISHTIPNPSEVDLLFIEKSETEEVSFIHFILKEDEVLETDEAPQVMEGYIPNEYIYSLEEWEAKLFEAEESDVDQDLENDADEDIHTEENLSEDANEQPLEDEQENNEEQSTEAVEEDLEEQQPEVVEEAEEAESDPSTEESENEASEIVENKPANLNIMTFSQSASIQESKTSRLGHFRAGTIKVYKQLNGASFNAGDAYKNKVYYIKRQAKVGNNTFYLMSTEPSATKGVVGWVNAKDVSTHTHTGVDKHQKVLTIKGNGKATTKAWGGSKDTVYGNMNKYKGQSFRVNLTEKVGNNTWYRGDLDGKRVWLHANYVEAPKESATSRLGHFRAGTKKVYKQLNGASFNAGDAYKNKVYYIKRQAKVGKDTFYLLSTEPSATKGVIGWVNAKDLSTHPHTGVDKQKKNFTLKGNGKATSKAWGGSKDTVFSSLTKYKGQAFQVHLTEKVGNNTWYRGDFQGKRIWVHASQVEEAIESKTSRLGHFRAGTIKVYKELNGASFNAGDAYKNKVYYIKRQAKVGNDTFYLLSTEPSATKGVIGWVNAKDLSTHPHTSVDKQSKIFTIKGTGKATSKAWGGNKDTVFSSLTKYKGQVFQVHLTEKVGNNTWYRGDFQGKRIWVHSSYVEEKRTPLYENTQSRYSFNEALSRQTNANSVSSPIMTDKFRNKSSYVSGSYLRLTGDATIYSNTAEIKEQANVSSKTITTLKQGDNISITGHTGSGNSLWYSVNINNKTYYVHSADVTGTKAISTAIVNVREGKGTTFHAFAQLNQRQEVNVVNYKPSDSWHQIRSTWLRPLAGDIREYLDPNKNDEFQHLRLDSSVNVPASELNKLLAGKGVLNNRGQAFINAAKAENINEVYLISHAILETGHGTSALANGVEVGLNSNGNPVRVTNANRNSLTNIKTTYNMFGIGAVDGNALNTGAIRAYNEGWFTPDTAIRGGAKFIGEKYIHGTYKQNTLYKMRWNPVAPSTHQYASDIAWSIKQISNIKNMYNQLNNPTLHFDIVKYK
ncbi:GW dipeptide domain-containing protein [Ornithinibacillus sp. 4-3]|uniref:GW dipeptide domain-containing protein n=1 Tax=Ornithinibacillus sp. 4-3 TaxID=3231488 RepID=A0AB39HP65_9BACI